MTKEPHPYGVPRQPTNIDAHVGSQLRNRRAILGWSQTQLGEALGLTFQQIQKYERGMNRIGASRLWDMSRALEIPITYFFEGIPPHQIITMHDGAAPTDSKMRAETLKLVRAYYMIADRNTRRAIVRVVRSIAGDPETEIDADLGDDPIEASAPLFVAPPKRKPGRPRKNPEKPPKVGRGVVS